MILCMKDVPSTTHIFIMMNLIRLKDQGPGEQFMLLLVRVDIPSRTIVLKFTTLTARDRH